MTFTGPPSRAELFAHVLIAHFAGLLMTSIYGSLGTTGGVSLGLDASLYIGWVVSLPWIALLALAIWKRGGWLSQHMARFCLIGPPIVWASYFLTFGDAFIGAAMLSSTVSTAVLAAITGFGSWRRCRLRQ